MSEAKKIFILDTNVILHDSACIHPFNEHDIVILRGERKPALLSGKGTLRIG